MADTGRMLLTADDVDRAAFAADLSLVVRYSSWDRDPWPGDGSWALTVHRPR